MESQAMRHLGDSFLIRCRPPLLALVFVVCTPPTQACTLCFPFPRTTATDRVLECPTVLFAREHPEKPFTYVPTEILKGKTQGEEIDLLVDSQARRRLAVDRDLVAVLAQSKQGSWHHLGLADREYQNLVRVMVHKTSRWQGLGGSTTRVDFFLPLLGSKHAQISRLAYLEVSRAPYRKIKLASRLVSRKQMHLILRDPQYIEWRSLAILMLAQVADNTERDFLLASFRSAERFGLATNLTALAIAYVELKGRAGVTLIESRYFRNTKRKKAELLAVLKALSVHGTDGHVCLRDQIIASYSVLLANHPELAGLIARDCLQWKRFELAPHIVKMARTNSPNGKVIRRYLRLAAISKQGEKR